MQLGRPGGARPLLEIRDKAPALTRQLRAGQELAATVGRDADGRLVAKLGRLLLPLPRASGFTEGDVLTLRVRRDGDRIALEVVKREPPPLKGTSAALRRDLPRQMPPGTAVRAARAALQPEAPPLPRPVTEAITNLLARLPSPEQLKSADGLRAAMRDSGVYLEALLATAPRMAEQIAGRDLKVLMSRLAARIRAAGGGGGGHDAAKATQSRLPPQQSEALARLGQAVEGALSRMHVAQVHASRPDAPLDVAINLPVADDSGVDDLYLRLREEDEPGGRNEAEDESQQYSVVLRFGFSDLGTLEARARLWGSHISVNWWIESADTARRVEEALPDLTHRLEGLGLSVTHVSARTGTPPPEPPATGNGPGGILNDQA